MLAAMPVYLQIPPALPYSETRIHKRRELEPIQNVRSSVAPTKTIREIQVHRIFKTSDLPHALLEVLLDGTVGEECCIDSRTVLRC